MKRKTISAHYDTVFSLAHNNRDFIPKNVDAQRIKNNLNLVMAGEIANEEYPEKRDLKTLWSGYRTVSDLYWREYSFENREINRRILEIQKELRWFRWWLWKESYTDNLFLSCLRVLFLPITIAITVAAELEVEESIRNLELDREWLYVSKLEFSMKQKSLRAALQDYDLLEGTRLLSRMDAVVWQSEILLDTWLREPLRFATIEEIYNKVFEPGFRQFQARQRKCRRYEGTYLEQIRERQTQMRKAKNRSEKIRTQAEAIEIVFGIGDMDNTGYFAAQNDAVKAEELLKEFCVHLLAEPNICTVTSKELYDPRWKPPFRNGLILVNLVGHFDEATPGIHATFIPYSSGCKRGPTEQPSIGRAMAGMGYPSTWIEVLDETGEPIPKRDRNGELVRERNGKVRTKKEPDKQGIIDWIEKEKIWLQEQMLERYGWEREYKGSHPRGNLSTPDYKVARSQERLQEAERQLHRMMLDYTKRSRLIMDQVQRTVTENIEETPELQIILNYAKLCDEERYQELLSEALQTLEGISQREKDAMWLSLQTILDNVQQKRCEDKDLSKKNNDKEDKRLSK